MKYDPELSWKAKDLMEQQEREEEVRKRIENHVAVLREDFSTDEVCRAGIETFLDAYCGLFGSGATSSYLRRLADTLEERNPEQTVLPF